MDEYKEFSNTENRWTAVTNIAVTESQARAQARLMRDEYIAEKFTNLGKKISGQLKSIFTLPLRSRGA